MEKGNAKFVRVTPEEQSFIEKMADKYKTSFSGAATDDNRRFYFSGKTTGNNK